MREADSRRAQELLGSDPVLMTGRHTVIEVRRNLARLLNEADASAARDAFMRDVEKLSLIELDVETCELAAAIAEVTRVRTLDALHLAAAQRAGGTGASFLTFDVRQAQAARGLGFTVIGA